VVSASVDRTLKVWDLASARCLYTFRGETAFRCVAVTADVIVAGDGAGTVWFLEWPRGLFHSSQDLERPRRASSSHRVLAGEGADEAARTRLPRAHEHSTSRAQPGERSPGAAAS